MTASVSAGHSAAESILMEGAFPMVDGSAAESPAGTRVCKECDAVFRPKRRNNIYCSHPCSNANAARAKARLTDGTLPRATYSPDEWDGKELFSYVEERTYMYALVCVMCGRRQCDDVRLTRKQAASPMRLPKCFACRGNVFLEDVDTGAIGSPRLGRNTIYQPVTALHMGITVR